MTVLGGFVIFTAAIESKQRAASLIYHYEIIVVIGLFLLLCDVYLQAAKLNITARTAIISSCY